MLKTVHCQLNRQGQIFQVQMNWKDKEGVNLVVAKEGSGKESRRTMKMKMKVLEALDSYWGDVHLSV